MKQNKTWNIALEISPMLAASGEFGDKSGVYRYSYNLITALSDYLEKESPQQRIILFSFFPDLFRKLAPDLAALEKRSNIILLKKWPIQADPLFTYDSVKPRLLYRTCRKINHLYTKGANKFIRREYFQLLRRELLENRVGVIHQSETIQQTIPDIPNVITIHDLVAVKFPEWQREETVRIHKDKLEYTRTDCAGIIAVSNHTAKDLKEYYGNRHVSGAIKTIYEAAEAFQPAADAKWSDVLKLLQEKGYQGLTQQKYFIHIGTFDPRKNIDLLVEGFIDNYTHDPAGKGYRLVLIGGSGWGNVYSKIKKRVADSFPKQSESPIIILDYVSDSILTLLLHHAYSLVYPSRYEGFGLPILEAMQFGLPVIASNATSIPEVCGTACRLVEPNSSEALAKAMAEMIHTPALHEKLVTKSRARVNDFSWLQTAKETYDLYRSVRTVQAPEMKPRGSWIDHWASQKLTGASAFDYLVRSIRLSLKNIYLVSAVGYGNVGDDLMLHTLIQAFQPKQSSLLMDGINDNPELVNLLRKQGFHVTKNRSKLYRSKSLVVIGGGTLFNTDAYPDETYLDYAYQLLIEGFRVGFMGIEVVDIIDRVKARFVFRNAEFIGVRNQESKDLITHITENDPSPVFVTGDIVNYTALPQANPTEQQPIIGVCISPKTRIPASDLKKLVKAVEATGTTAEFFSFCNHPFDTKENDLAIAQTIAGSNCLTEVNLVELLKRLSTYHGVITSRFHATLIAHRLGKNVIVISREVKCIRFCKDNNIPRYDDLSSFLSSDIHKLAHYFS